jgi:hypothetical protein
MDEATAPPDHDPARPDLVLFNGGLFESQAIRDRVLEVLTSWFQRDGGPWEPIMLANDRLDLAVARGAAYYGMVRRGKGVRIAAGLARTYYIGVESQPPAAVCLVPAGVEPGHDVDLISRSFDLRVSEPVEFPLYVSSTRLVDRPGEVLAVDREQMTPLPPIRTVLKTSKKGETGTIAVSLHARLTEIGTLDLWCSQVEGRRSWRLQFDVRSATQTDVAAQETTAESEGLLDEAVWQRCASITENTFGPTAVGQAASLPHKDKPEGLVKRLAEAVGSSRNEWPTSLLRRIWEALIELESGRRKSAVHEARWLNLLGFALRPGYGLTLDDWRVAETWRRLQGNLVHPATMCRAEWWILWRRIAGGLTAGQQQALADPLLGPIRALHYQMTTGRGRGGEFSVGSHETAEVWRFLGSLELLTSQTKIELGDMLLDLLPKRKVEATRPAIFWALARLGARQPVYGPLNTVVPAETAAAWLKKLMDLDEDVLCSPSAQVSPRSAQVSRPRRSADRRSPAPPETVGQAMGGVGRRAPSADPMSILAAMQTARRTGDRYRDIPDKTRTHVLDWLDRHEAPAHFAQLVREVGQLDVEEQGLVFGESLPKGLRIV